MKQYDSNHNDTDKVLIAVPQPYLDSLLENQKEILALLKGNNYSSLSVGDYISEEEAQKLLGRKTTWFWDMRTKGKLSFSKVGNKIYYCVSDIEKLLDSNKKKAFNETSLK